MECTKKVDPKAEQWTGRCRECTSEFTAYRSELKVDRCPREHYEFAHHDCSICGAKAGCAIIFYPKNKR